MRLAKKQQQTNKPITQNDTMTCARQVSPMFRGHCSNTAQADTKPFLLANQSKNRGWGEAGSVGPPSFPKWLYIKERPLACKQLWDS